MYHCQFLPQKFKAFWLQINDNRESHTISLPGRMANKKHMKTEAGTNRLIGTPRNKSNDSVYTNEDREPILRLNSMLGATMKHQHYRIEN